MTPPGTTMPGTTMPDPFLTLAAAQRVPDPVRWIDVRWSLDGSVGREQWAQGHLPGAVHVDLDTELSSAPTTSGGRHPLPDPDTFSAAMRRAGVSPDTTVLVHDTMGGGVAARLVWMLRIVRHPAAVVLVDADELAERAVAGPVTVEPGTFSIDAWPDGAMVDIDEVAAVSAGRLPGTLVDVRDAARFAGDADPVDTRAGHIPGAVNRPWTDNLVDGRLRVAADQQARLATGSDNVVVSCGSGVTACHTALAMEAAGLARPRVFVGSWSAWAADESLPLTTGPDPG